MREQIQQLESELKYNKSRMFKRAHFLAKRSFMSFSDALKQVWRECKAYRKELSEKIEAAYMRLFHAYCPELSHAMKVSAHNEMMYKITTNK